MNLLWSRIYDVVIKTLLCSENYIQTAMKKNQMHRTNCYELLGFDIIIDSDLKPWLLEVNITPSFACDTPLDNSIKSTVVTDTFNLIGIKRFDRKKESINKIKHRMKGLYNNTKSTGINSASTKKGMLSNGIQGTSLNPGQANPADTPSNSQLLQQIDKLITEDPEQYGHLSEAMKKAAGFKYREYIRETLAEYQRRGNYIRIYPAKGTDMYD